jgi:replicative DNA helicase
MIQSHAERDIERYPVPCDLDAERSVLGTILAWPDRLDTVDGLLASHFYRGAHRHIWSAILALSEKGTSVDRLTVKDALARGNRLEEVGGYAYLASLMDGIPRSTNVEHYAQIVKDKAKRREMVALAQRISQGALGDAEDVDALIQSAARDLFSLEQDGRIGGFVSMAELAPAVMARIEDWCARQQHVTGLATGYDQIDDITSGLQPGELVVIAARPSMGKSALMMGMAKRVAMAGQTVGVCSLEMSAESLAMRELVAESGIDGYRMRRGYLQQRHWQSLSDALCRLANAKLWVDETPNLSAMDIRARARRLRAEHGLALLVIDYLQLMDASDDRPRDENRALAIGKMTRALKQLAKELKIPVVLLSQLSRAVESRGDKRPMLSDLRESGSIEQDADVVMFIYRDHWYNKLADQTKAEIIIAKQRNGPLGTVELQFVPELAAFTNAPSIPAQADLVEER